MKSARIEILLLIVVLVAAVAANEAPLIYPEKSARGFTSYPPIYPRSIASYDGWVLESGETTNMGGTANATAAALIVGDNTLDRQYRSILHFDTTPYHIPPTAVIYQAILRIKLGSATPGIFTTFGRILVDMRKPYFGTLALTPSDFQATATRYQVAMFTPVGSGWYRAILSNTSENLINKAGKTQFRIYFKRDDDDDHTSDTARFVSGNSTTISYRPVLEINYWAP